MLRFRNPTSKHSFQKDNMSNENDDSSSSSKKLTSEAPDGDYDMFASKIPFLGKGEMAYSVKLPGDPNVSNLEFAITLYWNEEDIWGSFRLNGINGVMKFQHGPSIVQNSKAKSGDILNFSWRGWDKDTGERFMPELEISYLAVSGDNEEVEQEKGKIRGIFAYMFPDGTWAGDPTHHCYFEGERLMNPVAKMEVFWGDFDMSMIF